MMPNNSIRIQGHEPFIHKIQGYFKYVESHEREVLTSFLSPVEVRLIEQMKPKYIEIQSFGGYPNAQRQVVCINSTPEFYFDIVCLHAKLNTRHKIITHRDVLGTLLGLGLKRDVMGDFLIIEQDLYIFVKEKIAQYIIDHCTLIANVGVSFAIFDQEVEYDVPKKELIIPSASLRMDCVVSKLAHCSRSKATEMIRKGFVKLNDVVLEENKQLCNNDYVSIRKIGRFQFIEVKSINKKNRLILRFDQFI